MANTKTLGDIIFKVFTEAGVGNDHPQLKSILENEIMQKPVTGENALTEFNSFIFQSGLNNEGLRQKLEGEIKEAHGKKVFGSTMEQMERKLLQALKAEGQETDPFSQLFKTDLKQSEKFEKLFNMTLNVGKRIGGTNANPDEDLKNEMERMKSEYLAQINGAKADGSEWEAKAKAFETESQRAKQMFEDYKMNLGIEKQVRSLVKFGDHIPSDALEAVIQAKINGLRNSYHIIKNNGEFKLYNLDDPTQIVTDPKTGQPLKFSDVLQAQFDESYLPKAPKQPNPTGGGGNPNPITGNNPPGLSPHIGSWKAKMDAEMQQ